MYDLGSGYVTSSSRGSVPGVNFFYSCRYDPTLGIVNRSCTTVATHAREPAGLYRTYGTVCFQEGSGDVYGRGRYGPMGLVQ